MADLEDMGLLYAPHTSAGRLPTDAGLRMFVDGLLEIGDLSSEERETIEARCVSHGKNLNEALGEATSLLAGLAQCAGLVIAPKTAQPLKHIEFVNLGDGRVLAVLVTNDGFVENRIIDMPPGTPPSALVQAGNYLNARLAGKTIDAARRAVANEIEQRRAQIDEITASLIDAGLAAWSGAGASGAGGTGGTGGTLIVKGQSRLLNEISAVQDLERVRGLFQALETEELLVKLLDVTDLADGVQIFIGAENTLFDQAGCSLVVAPFKGESQTIVGAIGVIGPARLNYARIIPMVDYTAKVIDRLIG
jgi:heat-inducible transcriptional repressor